MDTKRVRRLNVPVTGWVDFLLYFHHRRIAQELQEISLQLDKSDRRILEIGAGRKPCKKFFPKARYTCTDVVWHDGIDQLTDVSNMPYRDNSLDLVICNNVLEHIPTPERAVDEIRRCLRPEGNLFLVVPFLFPLHDIPHDYFRFTEYSLANLFHEWRVIDIKRVYWLGCISKLSYARRFVLYYIGIAAK